MVLGLAALAMTSKGGLWARDECLLISYLLKVEKAETQQTTGSSYSGTTSPFPGHV